MFLILIMSMIRDFLSFYTVVSKCEDWKEEHFNGLSRATVSIATPLQWSMRWDITSLVQSVNLIRAIQCITPIGLNIFSLRQQGNHGQNF